MKKEISRDFVRELSLAGDVSVKTSEVEVQTTTTTTTELAEVGNGAVIISEIEVSCC
jgi:hypothetical protein